MNTASWILCGIIGVSLILYFVFTFAKKIKIIQDISSVLIILAVGILNGIFLSEYIPDSYHILKLSTLAYSFVALSQLLSSFENNGKVKTVSCILFLMSLCMWLVLYKSIFYIYRIPAWINIVSACSYFVIFLLLFLIFIKKQNIKFYLFSVISALLISFLHYCALISLCFTPANFSIVKFIGITLLMGYVIFLILTNSVVNLKLKKLISFLTLTISFTLISLSNLMILN